MIEPLTNLIHSTSAMSLLYECINTVIAVLISISSGMPNHTAAIQLCVQKLRILIEDSDQNLKYLGLLAMSQILKTNPKSVQGMAMKSSEVYDNFRIILGHRQERLIQL